MSTIKINSVEIVHAKDELAVECRIEERSTAGFIVIDKAGSASYARGQPVEIKDSDDVLIFSGFIDEPESVRLSPSGGLLHRISCMDNHYLADKRLVVNSYVAKTAGYIVEDIFDHYLAIEGVTIGEIQAGPTVAQAIFNYTKVSDAYNALKELSGSFTWFIDNEKKLYFFDRDTISAPWQLDWTTHKAERNSVSLKTGNPLYRNFQYVWGGTDITSVQTATFTGDGVIKTFALGYPLAAEPEITEDAAPMDVGIKGIESGKDYYWTKGESAIFAEAAPGVGVVVIVSYYGQYPVIAMSLDSASIAARRVIEGGTGIIEDIEREAWHESKESARESAQGKLTQYCQDAEKFNYQTLESGLLPGQLQEITYAPFGFTAHQMLIESVSISSQGGVILYNVVCITGPILGSWSKFFSNLFIRQDQSIRVGGEMLLKLIAQPESLDLVETPSDDEDDFSGGLVNRWLNSAPIDAGSLGNVQHEALALVEVPGDDEHITEDYKWDDGCKWGFATWA